MDALNTAWWTSFWSHCFTDWNQIRPEDTSIHGLQLDWKRFISDQTIDFFLAESRILKEKTPEIPITTNFMKPDVYLDYWNFSRHVDIVSWNSYPRWHMEESEWNEGMRTAFFHDLNRSFRKQNFLLMESTPSVTNWQGLSISKKYNMHHLSSLQAIAHGSNSVMYFQWRQSRGGQEKFHGAVVSHSGRTDTQVFQDVARIGASLKSLNSIAESSVNSDIAVIYDFQNQWAIEEAQLPRNEEKNYQECCMIHHAAIQKQGVNCDLIQGIEDSLDEYRLIIAPMLYMLSDSVSVNLHNFVKKGGTLVLTYLSGMVDSSDICFLGGFPGPLKDLAGLWVEDIETLSEANQNYVQMTSDGQQYQALHFAELIRLEGAQVMAKFTHGRLQNTPALTRNNYGKGECYYLASRNESSFHNNFYESLLHKVGIRGNSPVKLPEGVGCRKRSDGENEYLFYMNFNDKPVCLSKFDFGYTDAIEGTCISGSLELDPYDMRIVHRLAPNY